MKERTRARSLALQVLYEIDMSDHPAGTVFNQRLKETSLSQNEKRRKSLEDFAYQIVFGIIPLTQKLDTAIADYAPDWPLDRSFCTKYF